MEGYLVKYQVEMSNEPPNNPDDTPVNNEKRSISKSVSFDNRASSSSSTSSYSGEEKDKRGSETGPPHARIRQRNSVTHSLPPTLRRLTKKKSHHRKSSKSLARLFSTNRFAWSWCPCDCDCLDSGSDESDNEDIDSFYNLNPHEEEIIARLQLAVNELGHPPTSYEIESEVLKWQRALEIEQRNYEEHGRPKFRYQFFRRNQYLMVKKHPLYATGYENQRRLETRLEEFRFGAAEATAADSKSEIEGKHSFTAHAHLSHYEEAVNYGSGYWKSQSHYFLATLSLMASVSNFLRFPQVCFEHGGFTFLVVYYIFLALIGQPLLYFEMLLGQFSLNGPSGFGRLHPWASGVPYAIGFVCVVFGTSKNVYLIYTMLYVIVGTVQKPEECMDWLKKHEKKCFPYANIEKGEAFLKAQREKDSSENSTTKSILSHDLFFREAIIDVFWQNRAFHDNALNWVFTLAYFLVVGIAFLVLRNSVTGMWFKKYLKYTALVPGMVFVILMHQIFGRGAFSYMWRYFLSLDFEHVYISKIGGKAFEMVLTTLGIGYGFHWSVSGKARFDETNSYRMSWHICGYTALFALLTSLVIYCEIGIVASFTGDTNLFHTFNERLGISFVCYSGALIKLGGDQRYLMVIFFLIFTVFGMWSQVVVTELLFRWIDQGYIVKGKPRHQMKRKWWTVICVFIVEMVIVLPHFFKKGASLLANDTIFEGYFAAYGVLLAELLVVVYLYGFGRFLVDVEIMTKIPMPALFQIQIRYIVIPTIAIFMILMLWEGRTFDLRLYPDRNNIDGWLLYIGTLANLTPGILIIVFAHIKWILAFKAPTNKVNPEPYRYLRSIYEPHRKRNLIAEQRYIAKVDAPSQSRRHSIRSEIYTTLNENMRAVYEVEQDVRQRCLDLLRFKRNQARWIDLLLKVLDDIDITSFRGLLRRLQLKKKLSNARVEVKFLKKAVEQFVHLAFFATQRRLQKLPKDELRAELTNELIKLTSFHDDDFDETAEDDSSDSSDEEWLDRTPTSSHDMLELKGKYFQLHRKILGKLDTTPEELRTHLEIRIKKALGIPCEMDLSVLRFLRRARSRKEREMALWTMNQKLPIDHFVPASISRRGEKIAYTIFHAVVVEGNDHFVLNRLPDPRPPIVRVSRKFVDAQPGKTLTEKFAYIVTKRMMQNVVEILELRNIPSMSKEQIQRHLMRVSDNVDDDVYDFLDPMLSCVIVIVSKAEMRQGNNQHKMYLNPRTRRKIPDDKLVEIRKTLVPQSHEGFKITTFKEMNYMQVQEAKWTDLLTQPPDIVFERSDEVSNDDLEGWSPDEDLKSSSGSQSSLSPVESMTYISHRPSRLRQTTSAINFFGPGVRRDLFVLEDETLQKRDFKDLALKDKIGETDPEVPNLLVDVNKIKHLSARKWTRSHSQGTKLRFTRAEQKLQRAVDKEARRRGDLPMYLSKSEKFFLKKDAYNLRKTMSLESLRALLDDEIEFESHAEITIRKESDDADDEKLKIAINLEEKLGNKTPNQLYIALGKILIVEHSSVPIFTAKRQVPSSSSLWSGLKLSNFLQKKSDDGSENLGSKASDRYFHSKA